MADRADEMSRSRPRDEDIRRMIATPQLHRLPAEQRGITLGDFLLPIRVGERMSSRIRHIALIAVGAVFIIATANIAVSVPDSPVPVTGQTLSIMVVGAALGLRRGLLSVGLYLLLGLFMPVYANHAHGFGTIAGFGANGPALAPLGGYLISFLFAAALVGWLAENGWDRHLGGAVGAMVLGEVVIYAIGVPWLAIALNLSPQEAVAKGLTPFLIGDTIKLLIAAVAFPPAWWLVGRRAGDR
jgi:biotin transport system substrate-specific component